MQMSGGHLLAAGLDGGNSLQFVQGTNWQQIWPAAVQLWAVLKMQENRKSA